MSRVLSYTVFVISYTVLFIGFQLLTLDVSSGEFGWWLRTLSPVLAAPFALLIAQRVGLLSAHGLLVATCMMAVAYYTLVWYSPTWSGYPRGPYLPLAEMAVWRVVRDLGMLIAAPLAWHVFVRRKGDARSQPGLTTPTKNAER